MMRCRRTTLNYCRCIRSATSPAPGDWLEKHFELGQTYHEYLLLHPTQVKERRTIYVQPLGEMNPSQKKIVDLAAEFLGVFYQLPVKVREDLSLDNVPAEARRVRENTSNEQILTTYLLNEVLKPLLPEDAVALIAFTATDLWPADDWNRVYGQASFDSPVGVWSMYCFGDPDEDAAAFQQCLLRTLKVSAHETGHIFLMKHCTLYECNMCGGNHLGELDQCPLEPCPHCLAKLCYATGADPVKRWNQLIAFYKARNLKAEQAFCETSLKLWPPPKKAD